MASVFLSYAREDAAKAKALSTALQKAGHDVWWDRHIHGGSEFAGEIQAALNSAQVVLVLWSRASVGSEWVRDEATEGRDSGRLLPVALDESKAPLGFRQRQSIDMAGWSGRGHPPNFKPLLDALSVKLTGRSDPANAVGPSEGRRRPSRAMIFSAAAAFLAVLLALGAWSYWQGTPGRPETPTLAILPFADLSPAGDKAYFAEGVAEAILSTLASEPNIRVIGRSSSKQFQDDSANIGSIRKALGVTHILEGSARTEGNQLRLSVRLVNAINGSQIWAENYDRQMSGIFAIQDEIGRSVAERLRGTLAQSDGARPQVTGIDGYTLYLAARAKMRAGDEKSLREAMELARKVIALDPNYAPGHAIYAQLISLLANNPFYWSRNPSYFFAGDDPRRYANRLARRHALRAVKLAPRSAEGYAALGLFAERPEDTVAALTRALALDPSRTELRLALGSAYGMLGRRADAESQFQAAAEMDPLWPRAVRMLAAFQASSDRHGKADAVVTEFLDRGGDPSEGADMLAMVARMRGDLAEAERRTREAHRIKPNPELATSLLILYQPSWLNMPEKVRGLDVVKGSEMFPRLVRSGENQAELRQVRSEGSDLWSKPWEELYIFALAAARDWQHLEKLYNARPDLMSRLCEHSNRTIVPIAMIVTLNARGRRDEATSLFRCLRQRLRREGSGPWAAAPSEGYLAFSEAQLLSISGDRTGALRALDRAVDKGWRGMSTSSKLSDYPALDPLRSSPDYSRIQARLSRILASQRQELLRSEAAGRRAASG